MSTSQSIKNPNVSTLGAVNLLPVPMKHESSLHAERFATTTFGPCIGVGNFEA